MDVLWYFTAKRGKGALEERFWPRFLTKGLYVYQIYSCFSMGAQTILRENSEYTFRHCQVLTRLATRRLKENKKNKASLLCLTPFLDLFASRSDLPILTLPVPSKDDQCCYPCLKSRAFGFQFVPT